MSRINELIERLCPDGVEYLELRNVCTDIIVPMRDRPKVFGGNIPWCRIEDVENSWLRGSKTGLMVSDETVKAMNLKVNPAGTVICACSASLGTYVINTVPLITNQTFIGLVCGERLLNTFLRYYMETQTKRLEGLATTGTISYVSRKKFDYLRVPVPPMEVQQEIVRTLDSFAKLEAELEAELEARKAQYAYYRDELLNSCDEARPITLGDVFEMRAGKAIPSRLIAQRKNEAHAYPCYGGNGLRGYVSCPNEMGGAVLIGRQGALCGNTCYATGDYYATEHAVVAKPKADLDMRFAYHLLTVAKLNQYKTAGAQPGLSVRRLERVKVKVPSLSEQQRIVSILDKFSTLTTDLTSGLPAEIAARRQQYAYYRDRLLSFKEKVA